MDKETEQIKGQIYKDTEYEITKIKKKPDNTNLMWGSKQDSKKYTRTSNKFAPKNKLENVEKTSKILKH